VRRWKIGSTPNSIVAISDDISQGTCVVAANLTFLKCPFGFNRDAGGPSGKAGHVGYAAESGNKLTQRFAIGRCGLMALPAA
jgi:hypothetical protein